MINATNIFPPKKFSIIDAIVSACYYIFCLLLFLSLAGLFKKEFILPGLLIGGLFLLAVRKSIEFKKHYLYFFILIPVMFTGILLLRGCFGGDGILYYLPWAKEIVLQARMPDFLFNTIVWYTSREPLFPLFQAGLFSLFGFANWVIAALPFFFAAATGLLIYLWLSEKGVKKVYIIFGILLLLTTPIFLDKGGEIGQEPMILFFFTAFFYYLEKFQRTSDPVYFLLIFLSATLAGVSKMSGLILFLPLGWLFIQNIKFKKSYLCLFLTFPLFLWLLRNYIIFDNPILPLLNGLLKGRCYNLILAADQIFQNFKVAFWDNVSARLAEVLTSLFAFFFPLIILSFYEFWKKRKIQYVLSFLVLLLLNLLILADIGYVRYLMPFLGVLVVYAVVGLKEASSRIFLSLIFFLNLWGLFLTRISLSKSQFFSPVEGRLDSLGALSQLIYDYRLIAALVLGLFFFFLISYRREPAKYLIVLAASTYLVKAESFQLGSWLNIWLPILSSIPIILVWKFAAKLKEAALQKSVIVYIIILLALNSWGMPTAYFLAHGGFFFPNYAEAYGSQPAVAAEIEKLEGAGRDFYIYAASASYFGWYHSFKIVISRSPTFHVITNLEYHNNLTSLEIHSLFKRSKIKYVINNHLGNSLTDPIFDKVKSRPDLFELIFEKEGVYLWRVK